MLKETGYQEKMEMLSPWFEEIIETVKKDLKNEHLKIDKLFCKKYFLGKSYQHVQVAEMTKAYKTDIACGNVGLGEFIATRWLLKNTDIYGYFEVKLKGICPNFEELEELPLDLSQDLVRASLGSYGAKKTYIFSVLNSVVFPKQIYDELQQSAIKETCDIKEKVECESAHATLEDLRAKHERELKALHERYEKKLSGMQKKYLCDTESLKKQIRGLQKKLEHE